MSDKMLRRITLGAKRAARSATGYYTGYIQKRQPVGKFELKQAALNMQYLAKTIENRSNMQQYHHFANRMLGDLEYRGAVRPATEEFNLAGNSHEQDVCEAEFYRTFQTVVFPGARFLRRVEREEGSRAMDGGTVSRIPTSLRAGPDAMLLPPVEDLYGFRGPSPAVYYLSPWEFQKWWVADRLLPPSAYGAGVPRTEWTEAGIRLWQAGQRGNFRPGADYVAKAAAADSDHVYFPDDVETQELRHRWMLVRRQRPAVPAPQGTPLPKAKLPADERCRLLNTYLRPWVLQRQHASAHVPHAADLSLLVSESLTPPPPVLRRLRCKTDLRTRSHSKAWEDYVQRHVVSRHAARRIQNFLLAHLDAPDHDEDAMGNLETEGANVPQDQTSANNMSLDDVRAVLQPANTNTRVAAEEVGAKRSQFERHVAAAVGRSLQLWSPGADYQAENNTRELSKEGSVSMAALDGEHNEGHLPEAKHEHCGLKARLCYEGLTAQGARAWQEQLAQMKPGAPSPEQVLFLNTVIQRCLQERVEEQADAASRSEPVRCVLHGVPGAGKSQTLQWLRAFFEDVCGFRHGVEFVYLAAQNTQAAHIKGFTLHSFGGVEIPGRGGRSRKEKEWVHKDQNKLYTRYEQLRWIIVDELSSASAEVLAEFEHNVRTSLRAQHSWRDRGDGSTRLWGGINVVVCGSLAQSRRPLCSATPSECPGTRACNESCQLFGHGLQTLSTNCTSSPVKCAALIRGSVGSCKVRELVRKTTRPIVSYTACPLRTQDPG